MHGFLWMVKSGVFTLGQDFQILYPVVPFVFVLVMNYFI